MQQPAQDHVRASIQKGAQALAALAEAMDPVLSAGAASLVLARARAHFAEASEMTTDAIALLLDPRKSLVAGIGEGH